MAVIRVLKPFVFTFSPARGERVPTEERFPKAPGVKLPVDIEIRDNHPLLRHPWFLEDHCDGHVESPAQAQARVEQEKAALEAQIAQNAASLAAANAAMERVKNAGQAINATKEEMEEELNTPIPQLKARQAARRAAGIDSPGGVREA